MTRRSSDEKLLERFVGSFCKLDELFLYDVDDPAALQLESEPDDSPYARRRWAPAAMTTDQSALAKLYEQLPGPFPKLYEQAICSYRWLDVYLGQHLRLFGNPPGVDFAGLLGRITADRILTQVLLPAGYVPFGLAGDDNYDQICFAISRRKGDDCPVVRIEHETPLTEERIGDLWEIAPSFRELVQSIIDEAEQPG